MVKLTNDNPTPHHDHRAPSMLFRLTQFMIAPNTSVSVRTKPYEKVELTPVMILMMEKDTPKFCKIESP